MNSNKYLGKYRNESSRASWWDYSQNAAYFITICTHHREFFFGEIQNGTMNLSQTGTLAQQFWLEIPNHFPDIQLDAFVVMPNHTHGILIIDKQDGGDGIVGGTIVGTPKLWLLHNYNQKK